MKLKWLAYSSQFLFSIYELSFIEIHWENLQLIVYGYDLSGGHLTMWIVSNTAERECA